MLEWGEKVKLLMDKKRVLFKAFFNELDRLYEQGQFVKVRGKYYVVFDSHKLADKYHVKDSDIADAKNLALDFEMIEKTFTIYKGRYIQLIKYREGYDEKLLKEMKYGK